MSKKKSTFWKDFKAFITRGNVVDMAVGVVVGGAFSKIVTGLVNYIINPCVAYLTKGGDLDSLKVVIVPAAEAVVDAETGAITTPAVAEIAILWGTWLQTIIDFIIVAFCIFVVLRLIMRAKRRIEADKIAEEERKAAEAAAAAEEAKKAAENAAAAKAAAEEALKKSIANQETLLAEIRDILKSK